MVTMDEQKTSNKNSGGGVLTYWVKAAPEASLQAVEAEVASLKKSVSDGKTLVAGAITDKGITTATDAAFATMADNINQISTLAADTADATATAAQILTGAKAYVKGAPVVGTMPNNGGSSTAIAAGKLKAGYTEGGAIANLSAGNVKKDVNIGGVVGSYLPEIKVDNIPDQSASIGSATNQTITRNITFSIPDYSIIWGLYFYYRHDVYVGSKDYYDGSSCYLPSNVNPYVSLVASTQNPNLKKMNTKNTMGSGYFGDESGFTTYITPTISGTTVSFKLEYTVDGIWTTASADIKISRISVVYST